MKISLIKESRIIYLTFNLFSLLLFRTYVILIVFTIPDIIFAQQSKPQQIVSSEDHSINPKVGIDQKNHNAPIKAVSSKEMNIIILGIITSSSSKESVALIKNNEDKKVKALKVGFKLLDKYVIKQINSDSIMIEKDNAHLIVYKGAFYAGATQTAQSSIKKPINNREYKEQGFNRKTSEDEIAVELTGTYRDDMVKNKLQQILMEAATTPVLNNNSIIGFKISDITPGSIFEKAGFEDGDIITQINSTVLNSPTSAISVLHSIKKSTSVDVLIVRNGRSMDMTISVN